MGGMIAEYQSGFRTGRSTTDHIFSVMQMLMKSYEHQMYIDFKHAYDSIVKGKLFIALRNLGIQRKLLRLAQVQGKGVNKVSAWLQRSNGTQTALSIVLFT